MSAPNPDDKLKALRGLKTPAPSEAARQRALDMAMLAYDEAQQASSVPAKGVQRSGRLRSMFDWLKGAWTMDTRLSYGFGTAAVALLLLPIGYQLYNSTAFSPVAMRPEIVASPAPAPAELGRAAAPAQQTVTVTANGASSVAVPQAQMKLEDSATMDAVTPRVAAPATSVTTEMEVGMAEPMAEFAPAPTRMLAQPAEPSGDSFADFAESPVKMTAEEPVSTFSIDVDTASYSYVRRMLSDGYVPEPDAVRIEELLNYFSYDYATPTDSARPFEPTVIVYPSPWAAEKQLVQIGIKGYVPPVAEDKPSNLVFLIDTSGSMDEPDKLPLLKRAFALLVDRLSGNDTVSIVAYAGSAGVVLKPTKATDKATILSALENLSAGGSTAGAEGIALAYQLADEAKVDGGVNRVILATDGDFNVGIDDPEALKDFIKARRDTGVYLSVLGFGQGNLDDETMQALAQNGNGNASYIDSFQEAQKVLVAEGGGTLETIAKDVKIQVEFNPVVVGEYRLIGYETRALNREDFNNDKVDAGEIGAGTTVTALYEITPVGAAGAQNDPLRYGAEATAATGPADEIGYLKLRYKAPDSDTSQLMETPIRTETAFATLDAAPDDARFAAAVAAFGQKLKGSDYVDMSWREIRDLARGARGTDLAGYRAEFVQLIGLASDIEGLEFLCTAPEGNRNCR
jgi:Ca-activated chloride channel family protein